MPTILFRGVISTLLLVASNAACSAGRYRRSDNMCVPCGAGTYSSTIEATSCTNCAAGRVAPVMGSISCTVCMMGQFSYQVPVNGRYVECRDCPAGQYQNYNAQAFCKNCDPDGIEEERAGQGDYQDEQGQSSCKSCAVGTISLPDPSTGSYNTACVSNPTSMPTLKPTPLPTPEPTQFPTPLPTPEPTYTPSGSCFHASGTVTLASGAVKKMTELSLDDVIMTADKHGNLSTSKVLFLPHEINNTEAATFLKLTMESAKYVLMTHDHLIPLCGEKLPLIMASELSVGDCLVTVDGKETLREITSVVANGIYTAVTKDKFIVVDGIVASPFSKNSDRNYPKREYEKYISELEHEWERKQAYANRKLNEKIRKMKAIL